MSGTHVAIAGLALTMFLQTIALAFWLGGVSARLRAVESRPQNDDCAVQLAALNATLSQLKESLNGRIEALEHTMRNLLMRPASSARRKPAE